MAKKARKAKQRVRLSAITATYKPGFNGERKTKRKPRAKTPDEGML